MSEGGEKDKTNIIDLHKRARKRSAAMTEEEKYRAAYKIIDEEVDALIVLEKLLDDYPSGGPTNPAVDMDAVHSFSEKLFSGPLFNQDGRNIWDEAKRTLNLPTLVSVARQLRAEETNWISSGTFHGRKWFGKKGHNPTKWRIRREHVMHFEGVPEGA
jgi:hypothetical protein